MNTETTTTIAPTAAAVNEPHVAPDPAAAPLVTQQAQLPTTGAYDYMPRDLAQAMEFATQMSKSSMVPKDYIDKPGNVLIAIQMGAELGLKPLQAMQSLAVINGKPGLYGDAGKALLLSHGCQIIERELNDVRAQEEASCTVIRPGRPPVTRTFSKADAVTAKLWGKEGPWTNYPWRQMSWRAFWWSARDAAADILKGMAPAEELADMPTKDVTSEGSRVPMPKATGSNGHQQHETSTSTADTTPASEGMMKHLRKRLDNASLSTADVHKKFPDVAETLEGLTVAQANAVLGWTANPTS